MSHGSKLAVISIMALGARDVEACGGFFCDQDTVTLPPEQSAERIVFVVNPAPEGYTAVDPGDPPEPSAGATVDIYVEIAYTGAAESFAWVVPLLTPPLAIGTADRAIFDDLDAATAPRFTFTFRDQVFAQTESSSGGCGASSSDSGGDTAYEETPGEPEVTVLSEERIGPYEVAVIQSDDAADLEAWLLANDYQVPPGAQTLLAQYVAEDKTFAAFRLADGKGVGAIEPVVIRTAGGEPCIPLRLTSIASAPILSVSALVIGPGRAVATNYQPAGVAYDGVRPSSPVTSDYGTRLRSAVAARGGLAFETEFAAWTSDVEVATEGAAALLAAGDFVTRLSTRMAPGEMTADPIFVVTPTHDEVTREHVVDITGDEEAQAVLDGFSGDLSSADYGGAAGCVSAGRPAAPLWPLGLLISLALLLRPRAR